MQLTLITSLLTATLAGSAAADTNVKYCSGTSLGGTCFDATLANGVCQNVDLSVNDQTHSAQINGGQCVFWAEHSCNGDHTDMRQGYIEDFNGVCGGGWQKRISSFKCCDTDKWCAGDNPKCA